MPIEEISLQPELSGPPRFRIQGGSPERDGGAVVGVGVGVVAAQHFLILIKDFFTKESVYSNPLTLRCVLSLRLVLVGLL